MTNDRYEGVHVTVQTDGQGAGEVGGNFPSRRLLVHPPGRASTKPRLRAGVAMRIVLRVAVPEVEKESRVHVGRRNLALWEVQRHLTRATTLRVLPEGFRGTRRQDGLFSDVGGIHLERAGRPRPTATL